MTVLVTEFVYSKLVFDITTPKILSLQNIPLLGGNDPLLLITSIPILYVYSQPKHESTQ